MPAEIPLVRRITETGYKGAVVYLNTDAPNFWSVIKRHALNNLETLYGGRYIYRAMGHDASKVNEVMSSLNELGTYVWLDDYYESKYPQPVSGYWHGAKVGWETIGQNRLRVVITSHSDLMPNLLMAWNILGTILDIYPEAREQLLDVDGLVESWAYEEATRAQWREAVKKRKDWEARDAAFYAERKDRITGNANITLASVTLEATATTHTLLAETEEYALTGQPVTFVVSNNVPSPEDVRVHYLALGIGSSKWWNAMCGWYDAYKKIGYRLSQREFANLCGYSLSHTKRNIRLWRAENEGTIPNDTK